jgi:hypothetical protein
MFDFREPVQTPFAVEYVDLEKSIVRNKIETGFDSVEQRLQFFLRLGSRVMHRE